MASRPVRIMSAVSSALTLVALSLASAQGAPRARAALPASPRPLWGDLRPGPYAVGFRTIYRLDRSRVWDPSADSIARGEFARPIRLSLWYPARPARGAVPMSHRGYFYHRAPTPYFARLDSLVERADIEPTRRYVLSGSDSLFRRLLALPTAAFPEAPAAPGRFPLVAYSEGYNNRSQDNTVLAEYLASHGFVVVTVPQVGTRATRLVLGINPVDLETQTRDVEFALGKAQSLPFVDRRKLATMGYSMGGVVALLIAARNSNVDAVVGLDPSFRAPRFVSLVTNSPYFVPRRLRVPLLSLQSGAEGEASAQDTTVVGALTFADRAVAQVGKAAHGDFSDFAAFADLLPVDIQGRTAVEARQAHGAVSRYVLAFLKGALQGDSAAARFARHSSADNAMPAGLVRMTFRPGVHVPSEDDLVALVARRGESAAIQAYRDAQARAGAIDVIDQTTLNRLGYGLLEAGRAHTAVGVFRLNVEAHPTSADAQDSLAEGLLAAGDRVAARLAYQRVLALIETDPALDSNARAEYRRSTEDKLKALLAP